MADIESLTQRLPTETKEEISRNDLPLKDRFFRYFQQEITGISYCHSNMSGYERANTFPALQEQMNRLADTSLVAGERSDATDHCLAGIARLSNEVKDASSYIPTYDQRIYAEVSSQAIPSVTP